MQHLVTGWQGPAVLSCWLWMTGSCLTCYLLAAGPGGSDVEAFVRMVQEAPPLQRSGSMQDGAALSIDSALHQFELLKAQATQLASGIAPALAEQ